MELNSSSALKEIHFNMTNLVVSEYPGHGEPFGIVPHQTPTRLNVPHKQNDSVMAAGNYKDSIKDASQALVKANEIIFDSLINVETQGDLKEWNSTVPEREIHQFDFEIFRNSGDLNVQLLVKLMENIGETYQILLNINGLEVDGDED